MATPNIHQILHSFIFLVCAIIFSIHNLQAAEATGKSLFVFGDSLFDVGNNQYYTPALFIPANYHPYGMSYFAATGRHSDGLLVPDFIAQYAEMPLIPPALDRLANGTFGYNFASAGSGVLYHEDAMNLNDQLALFVNLTTELEKQKGEEEYKNVVRKSVYMFSMGGNDYVEFITELENATEKGMQHFVDFVIDELISSIKDIYLKGGRKFAFQDVGPLGCMPIVKFAMGRTDGGCYEKANTIAKMHNKSLRKILKNLTQTEEYRDIKYGVFDYHHQLSYRINNITTYGFLEGEIACCGYGGKINAEYCGENLYFLCSNPSAFVLFDGRHTTQRANSQLAELMWSGDQSFIGPYNVKQLFEIQVEDQQDQDQDQ